MKRIRDKAISAAGTVLFMALIRTNANPTLWQVALIALGLYEAMLMACKEARKSAYRKRMDRYIIVNRQNARRWADTRMVWPMKEVG